MPSAYGSGISCAGTIHGPAAHEPRYILACGRYSGFSPSMLRELTSLTIVYPTISPFALHTNANSGSGTSQAESSRTPIGSPGPRTRCPTLLKNSSGRSASYTRE